MAYSSTSLEALFPYIFRDVAEDDSRDEVRYQAAQNERNLNQNLETLYRKLIEIEENYPRRTAKNGKGIIQLRPATAL
jgi:hypothetical protein